MDEADNAMQAELASQAGSIGHSDKMELEQEDQQTVRDAEMEIHDIEAEGTLDEMKAALAEDAEMNAEMQEQEHMQAERDWKDVDAEVDVVPLDDASAEQADSSTPVQVDVPESADVQPLEQLEDATSAGNGITDNETSAPPATAQAEAGQQTLTQDLGLAHGIAQDLPQANEDEPRLAAQSTPDSRVEYSHAATSELGKSYAEVAEPPAGPGEGDQYANADEGPDYDYTEAYEPVASTSAAAVDHYDAPVASGSSGYRKPILQKDYLTHVEVFAGPPPLLGDGSNALAAPHVSLLYNNDSYSLFRPSSVPSGDDETVLFESDEDQQLYYSNLDLFIGRLHEAFPQFRGDGDNELILDFGILDMQIAEDNVYTQQLSLHDFDKIRVGMSQPELDRLQITLLIGKRFVYKFNELAEHVYRMHAGSEYDSGTVYDETVEEEEVPEEIPEYYDEGAAEEDAQRTAEEAQAVVTGDDLLHGVVEGHNAEEGHNALTNSQDTSEEEPVDYPEGEDDTLAESKADVVSAEPAIQDDVDPSSVNQELHPPSDEYYDDPEFSQHIADEEVEEPYEEQYDDQEEHEEEHDSDTVQEYTEGEPQLELDSAHHQEVEEVEAAVTIDPEAPLDEVAEQIEEFEEGTLKREEDAAAEAKAAALDEPIVASTSVNVEAVDKDTERIYDGMDSLAAEEQGKVHAHAEPASAIAPVLPIATISGTGKRSRDEEAENAHPSAPNGVGAAVAQAAADSAKKPRVSPDA